MFGPVVIYKELKVPGQGCVRDKPQDSGGGRRRRSASRALDPRYMTTRRTVSLTEGLGQGGVEDGEGKEAVEIGDFSPVQLEREVWKFGNHVALGVEWGLFSSRVAAFEKM
ncbi:hypothetical protein BC937DRAFT_88012 [Endogone sp. FLAS-F59071]|nr:hypothetical protein BC937DRAFT_88012 [Endogone sp. FLAS-F59071]|eukprot:RUS19083.1 hypothetical protein BC937DRAFT_88012 [Endogone sp. FLAS-F59071]